MKARIDSNSDPAYGNNNFEKVTKNCPTAFKLTSNKRANNSNKSEFNKNVNKLQPHHHYHHHQQQQQRPQQQSTVNGYYSGRGTNQGLRNGHRLTYSDDYQGFKRDSHESPLHFDTREILEETPAIFKSLNSGSVTFVYLSSGKQSHYLSQNEEDPCKTFVISPDTSDDFVNKKNSLNQFASNGHCVGKIINVPPEEESDNEYPSYVVIEKKDEGISQEKMSDAHRSGTRNDVAGSRYLNGEAGEKEKSENSDGAVKNAVENSRDKMEAGASCRPANASENCQRDEDEGQQYDSDGGVLSFDRTITGKKEQTFAKLQDELQKAHRELKLKDEEVARLTRIREDVERELEELTASLFQEAHRMVSKAKEKQAAAEKSLAESQMKMDVLSAEVVALKTLVLTSTPSRPNPHLHPQIGKDESGINGGGGGGGGGVNLFNRKHRRSPSHFNLKYGRENSPPDSPIRNKNSVASALPGSNMENRDISDVDPIIHKEFLNWSANCKLDKTDPFIDRIYREDINLCLDFSNRELAEQVQKAIETRNIFIEAVTDKSKTIFPRKCALLDVTRQCHYRMKLGDEDTWYNISQMCRNRIIAVCDFINYLRYIELGLVKSSPHEIYWEIMKLRKEMILARLGLSSPSS